MSFKSRAQAGCKPAAKVRSQRGESAAVWALPAGAKTG